MNPNNLRNRVKDSIEDYVDTDAWQQHKKIEKAERETTKKIATAMTEAGAK